VGVGILVAQAAGEEGIRGPQVGLALPERLRGERVSSGELLSFLERKRRIPGLLITLVVLFELLVGFDQEISGRQMTELVQDGQGQDQRGQAAWYEDGRHVHLLQVA